MKLLLLFFCVCFAAHPAGAGDPFMPLGGFLEIKWGTSFQDAKAAMLARGQTEVIEERGNSVVWFKVESFADAPATEVCLSFFEGKFYRAAVTFKPGTEFRSFGKLSEALTKKYRKPLLGPTGSIEYWRDYISIRPGSLSYFVQWSFDKTKDTIFLSIDRDASSASGFRLELSYMYEPMAEQHAKLKKELESRKLSGKDL